MKIATLPFFGLLLLMALPTSSGVAAQEASCDAVAGTYVFADLPPSRNDILPSIKKQFAALGLAASRRGCDVTVTCVFQAGAGASARDRSQSQCSAASVLLTTYETRAAVRSRVRSEMTVQNLRRPDATSLNAGTVHVTLQ